MVEVTVELKSNGDWGKLQDVKVADNLQEDLGTPEELGLGRLAVKLGVYELVAHSRAMVSTLAAKAYAAATAAGWMATSGLLILLNKHLMKNDGFTYPMAISALGMVFSSVAALVSCKILRLVAADNRVSWHMYLTKMMPVGLAMALSLHFGNAVYMHLSVSFIQILKAFTPVITMVALFVAGMEKPSKALIAAVCIIALGTAAASYGEVDLSWLGVTYMLLAQTFEATRLVMTQKLLCGLKFHPIEGLMYLAPACSFWLLLGMFNLEWDRMVAGEALQNMAKKPMMYTAASAMGFTVNILSFLVIQQLSSLTLKVLGTVKNAVVVWCGILWFNDHVSPLQMAGYAVSIGGFMQYSQMKLNKAAEVAQVVKPGADGKGEYVAVRESGRDSGREDGDVERAEVPSVDTPTAVGVTSDQLRTVGRDRPARTTHF